MKKKVFSLKGEYKKCFEYISQSKKFIFLIIGFFSFFFFIGLLVLPSEDLYNQIMKMLKEILLETENLSLVELIFYIIFNNLQSGLLGMLFGFIFGIFPLIITVFNGYLLGFVSLMSINNEGLCSLWKLFPHGIFELPAIFISLGLGLKFGTFVFQKEKINSFWDYLLNSIRVFLFIIIPLLILAGVIEGILIFLF
jgi:stage II sporulation protein M